MKTCIQCGRELPEEMFWKNSSFSGGLMSRCKDCENERRRNMRKSNKLSKGCNPELEKFTPRELIQELKARGYKGKLEYVQTIEL